MSRPWMSTLVEKLPAIDFSCLSYSILASFGKHEELPLSEFYGQDSSRTILFSSRTSTGRSGELVRRKTRSFI